LGTDTNDLHYLELLARQYPSIQAASTEIINLNAILHLPKGTEHFLSDIHGEQPSSSKSCCTSRKAWKTSRNITRASSTPSFPPTGPTFIVAMAELIQRLAIARLHVIGDVYDRGPGAHIIMDKLMDYHAVDVQWGNHDILWMGAAAGSEACIANVIRICLRYGNMETLENGYGISLLPLASFAMEHYADDPCRAVCPQRHGRRIHRQRTSADV
jgi:fructose-1,6-bisphosphatase